MGLQIFTISEAWGQLTMWPPTRNHVCLVPPTPVLAGRGSSVKDPGQTCGIAPHGGTSVGRACMCTVFTRLREKFLLPQPGSSIV